MNSKYVPHCRYSDQLLKDHTSFHRALCELTIFSIELQRENKISHTELNEKYKNNIKDFQKLQPSLET